MCFVKMPNLPESDVTLAAMSGTYPKIADALKTFGVELVLIRPCENLSAPVCSHADMLCHPLGGNQVVVAKGEGYLKTELEHMGFETSFSNQSILEPYPYDVLLNAARVGEKLLANPKTLDTKISNYCKKSHIEIVPVKQGYAKCSTVVINSDSIITADESITDAVAATGIDVLKITPGYVYLKGYDYGFLGGTCGMIGKNKLAFTGCIQAHPDYGKMKRFCSDRNVEIISLTDDPLTDIGGILPLKIEK